MKRQSEREIKVSPSLCQITQCWFPYQYLSDTKWFQNNRVRDRVAPEQRCLFCLCGCVRIWSGLYMGNLWILLFIYSNETKQANSVPWWIIFQLQVIVHPIIKIRSSLLTLMFLLNLLSVVEHTQKKIFWGMFLANLFHTSKMKNYIYKVLIFKKKNHHRQFFALFLKAIAWLQNTWK